MNTIVPRAFQVQLGRLFGEASREATAQERTPAEWKKTLKKTLDELYQYARTNIETDELHWLMICSAFCAANESLKEEFFWPGYVEGLSRLNLLVLGDYPDHRKRKTGKKKTEHYQLSRLRQLHYLQNQDQKLKVLLAAQAGGFPKLSVPPLTALSEFRDQYGYKASYGDFMRWYKNKYPQDYAALF
ncbi:MAG: hypothetical protein M0R41_11360 [Methylobacter tundripaludum]|nr:hypothetical protein [Methylobacter tundripaludum]